MPYIRCPNCQSRITLVHTTYREKRKARGLCARCKNPRLPDKTHCRSCLDKMIVAVRNRREKRMNERRS